MAPFTCAIIGEGNITLSCLRHLLQTGFRIDVVIANTEDVIKYCCERNIETFPRRRNVEAVIKGRSFDYLFSINNPTILSQEVLSVANMLTINYHDSLLPAYAGVHATSWAIIKGEKTHGISWHIVEPGIDTGHILQSQTVTINDDDSALTLNLKCFEACSTAFQRLVSDIQVGTLTPVPQNLEKRSYFGLYKVPPNLGVLLMDQRATSIYNVARAMEFGTHDNQLGSPKIFTPSGKFFLVTNAKLEGDCDKISHLVQNNITDQIRPGTVLHIADNKIEVTTATSPISLTLAELDGHQLKRGSLCQSGIKQGVIIPSVPQLDTENITQFRKKEPFWRRVMRSYDATTLFVQNLNVLPDIMDDSDGQRIQSTKVPIPENFRPTVQAVLSEFLVSAFIAFLGRSCCSSEVHVGLASPRTDIPHPYQLLYSKICPAVFSIDYSKPTENVIQTTLTTLESYRQAGTFLLDMFYRYPELRDIKRSPHHNIVIASDRNDTMTDVQQREFLADCHLLISISSKAMAISYADKLGNSYSRVDDVLRHFPSFLQSMTSLGKFLPFIDVDLISPMEKETLYQQPRFKSWEEADDILSHISDVANKYPNNLALTTTDSHVSFCSLLDEVSNLSYVLQQNLPDEYRTELRCIALHMPNSIAYVVSMLAAMSANCPFLPLPQNLPIPRSAFMLQDARATLMLTTREIQSSDKFQEFQAAPEIVFELETIFGYIVLLLIKNDQLYSQPSQSSAQLPEVYSFTSLSELTSNDEEEQIPLHPDCCYVMYTSGSTGRPKGVQVLRSGVLNMAQGQIEEWNLGPEDVIAQFASIGFDASISEIFTALLSGANLAILQELERLGKEFTTVMTKLNVTTVTLPPSVLNIYKPTDFPKLQKVITAGEACTVSTAVRWTINTNIRFFNAYGPTESTVCATIHEFDPSEAEDTMSKELPIGKAIKGVQVYLFDDFMKAVPPNVVGEVFIGGQSLSAGYTGHASSKNEERFLDNPLFPGFTIYKTGDHALQDEDGRLTYIGRMDDQIKIRGQRVDLNEIEQVLLQHSKVELAVVVKHQISPTSDPTIAAFVAPTFVYISELREFLSKALPSYMVPGYIKKMEIEEFPINLSGKIDRKKLEKDQTFLKKNSDTGLSHLSETQLKTAKLWCQVLQLEESHAYTMHRLSSFVEHGGNSLHMVLLQREIEKEFGTMLTFTEIGGASTIQDFSEIINSKQNVSDDTKKSRHVKSKEELRDLIIQDSILSPEAIGISDNDINTNGKLNAPLNPSNVLLSGATGFLGAFLLYEILEQTSAHVCCMVRESTEVLGFGRVVSNMKRYDLWRTSYGTRIAIVLSDISKTNMGIAPDIYKALSVSIDTVFMNAAKMNFNTDYADHKIANVNGTKEFIKFCFTRRKKFLFTTSSLGVFLFPKKNLPNFHSHLKLSNSMDLNGNREITTDGHNDYVNGWINTINDMNVMNGIDSKDSQTIPQINGSQSIHSDLVNKESTYIKSTSNGTSFENKTELKNGEATNMNGYVCDPDSVLTTKSARVSFNENDQVTDPSILSGGYNQSKWASERLVQQALTYLPGGAIFRPARISGDSKTGVGPTNDLFACTMKGIENLGYAPDLCFPYDLTPVDYCAKGMIEITNQICQSKDHNQMPIVYHFFNQATMPFLDLFKNTSVRRVPLEDWRVKLKSADRDNVLVPFTPFIESDFWDRSPDWPVFDTTNTDQFISSACKKCMPASDHLLGVYKKYFSKT